MSKKQIISSQFIFLTFCAALVTIYCAKQSVSSIQLKKEGVMNVLTFGRKINNHGVSFTQTKEIKEDKSIQSAEAWSTDDSLALVQNTTAEITLLSRNKTTKQSTNYQLNDTSDRVTDGIFNTDATKGRGCSHTAMHKEYPWLRIDLGKRAKVDRVEITNRGDCCGQRLHKYSVFLADTDATPNMLSSKQTCDGQYDKPAKNGELIKMPCHQKEGRYATLYINSTDAVISVCEIEVYGAFIDDGNNKSPGDKNNDDIDDSRSGENYPEIGNNDDIDDSRSSEVTTGVGNNDDINDSAHGHEVNSRHDDKRARVYVAVNVN